MNQKACYRTLPATFAVAMVAFLSIIFLADVNPGCAASAKKSAAAVAAPSAVEHAEARIKELQGTLDLTAGQQEPWQNLSRIMRENAQEMDAFSKERAETAKSMNAVERMKLHTQVTEAHLAQMKRLLLPFETFYDSLSAEQKKITDNVFRTGRHGKKKLR